MVRLRITFTCRAGRPQGRGPVCSSPSLSQRDTRALTSPLLSRVLGKKPQVDGTASQASHLGPCLSKGYIWGTGEAGPQSEWKTRRVAPCGVWQGRTLRCQAGPAGCPVLSCSKASVLTPHSTSSVKHSSLYQFVLSSVFLYK